MATMLADNMEEEYLWSISLNSTTKVQRTCVKCPFSFALPMTIIRNLCGTLKSRKKELAMEQLPTTGSPSPSFNFLTIKLRSYSNSQVADQNCHLDARGSGRRGDHFGGGDSGFREDQGELCFIL